MTKRDIQVIAAVFVPVVMLIAISAALVWFSIAGASAHTLPPKLGPSQEVASTPGKGTTFRVLFRHNSSEHDK